MFCTSLQVHAEELQGHAAPAWVVIRPDGSQTWLDFAELTERAAWDATEEAPRRTWDATEEALSTTLMFWMAAVSKPFCHVLGAGDDYIYDKANVFPDLGFISTLSPTCPRLPPPNTV